MSSISDNETLFAMLSTEILLLKLKSVDDDLSSDLLRHVNVQ